MKKIFFLLTIIFALACLTSCTTYDRTAEVDNMSFAYSDFKNDCYVGRVSYKVGDDTNIIIPDESDGYPVTSLGGYCGTGVPDPFTISFMGYDNYEYYLDSEEREAGKFRVNEEMLYTDYFDGAEVTVEDIKFTITLPRGLKKINLDIYNEIFYDRSVDKNGNIKIYVMRPIYYFEITEENEYFYTENGKLYNKQTNELIEKFIYHSYK